MARANGKKIIKKTGLIMAVILAVTGVASLLAPPLPPKSLRTKRRKAMLLPFPRGQLRQAPALFPQAPKLNTILICGLILVIRT